MLRLAHQVHWNAGTPTRWLSSRALTAPLQGAAYRSCTSLRRLPCNAFKQKRMIGPQCEAAAVEQQAQPAQLQPLTCPRISKCWVQGRAAPGPGGRPPLGLGFACPFPERASSESRRGRTSSGAARMRQPERAPSTAPQAPRAGSSCAHQRAAPQPSRSACASALAGCCRAVTCHVRARGSCRQGAGAALPACTCRALCLTASERLFGACPCASAR